MVTTGLVTQASCDLTNNKGNWNVTTPGLAQVHRSYGDLQVVCKKPGYETGHAVVQSKTKAMAFGNAVFGGIIGGGIDVAEGAAYDYPEKVDIELNKKP